MKSSMFNRPAGSSPILTSRKALGRLTEAMIRMLLVGKGCSSAGDDLCFGKIKARSLDCGGGVDASTATYPTMINLHCSLVPIVVRDHKTHPGLRQQYTWPMERSVVMPLTNLYGHRNLCWIEVPHATKKPVLELPWRIS